MKKRLILMLAVHIVVHLQMEIVLVLVVVEGNNESRGEWV